MLQALNPRMLKGSSVFTTLGSVYEGGHRREPLLPAHICLNVDL